MLERTSKLFLSAAGAILLAFTCLIIVPCSWAGPKEKFNQDPIWSKGKSQSPWPGPPQFSERREGRQRSDELSREENKRIEKQYREWQNLPPEEKEEMRRRMEQWRRMPPREQERYEQRYHQWRQLPPEEQKQLENQLQHWERLTPGERDRIRQRFRE